MATGRDAPDTNEVRCHKIRMRLLREELDAPDQLAGVLLRFDADAPPEKDVRHDS